MGDHHEEQQAAHEAVEPLRALIRSIDLGEITADETARSYIMGAADALAHLADLDQADE